MLYYFNGSAADLTRRANQSAVKNPFVQPVDKKYFSFSEAQISCMTDPIPSPPEGRIAIVTDVGSGMRWT
jgi:hypothetical protein